MTNEQQAILLLWQRVNTSLSAFYKLMEHFRSASFALQSTSTRWAALSIHNKHITRHNEATQADDDAFIELIEQRIATNVFGILFREDDAYPSQLSQLYDPPPLLFYRGNISRLLDIQIAIVGSRKPTASAQKFTFDMAQYLAQSGFIITSGLAQGVDAQAHLGALSQAEDASGRTIGVMGTGIDVCYPKQHKVLIERIINEGGCVISELLPSMTANKHTFPRRNRIVAGLALGTIVTEATIKSGSLITARLTSEQGKQVFVLPSTIDNVNAEGCHHLIREGATLIYHPDHVIDEISDQLSSPPAVDAPLLAPSKPPDTIEGTNIKTTHQIEAAAKPTAFIALKGQATNKVNTPATPSGTDTKIAAPTMSIPQHLQPIWIHIDWDGQDLDSLVTKTSLDTASLLAKLMELELIGAVAQVGGRYKRIT